MGQYTYVEAVGAGFPGVQCSAPGDGSVYESIVWESTVLTKETLDAWIAANPKITEVVLTKYEFRKLFTLAERVAIDSAPTNANIPAQYRAMLLTITKDLDLSSEVFLTNPDVAAGLAMLEQLGLIGPGRAAQILANQPPAA